MKILVAVFAFVSIISASYAQINIAWRGLGGFTQNDGVSPLLNPYPGQFAYAQLIWTPSGMLSPVGPGASLNFGGGDHVQLASFWVADDEWGSVSERFITTGNTGIPYSPGFIFARIFNGVDAQDVNLIGVGHHYYWGPLVALQDIDDPTAPQAYNMNRNQLGIGDPVGPGASGVSWVDDGFGNGNSVIPEPTVLAMLGFGGLLLTFRRRYMIG